MKKIYLALLGALLFSVGANGQISTSVTLGGSPISGSPFASFSAAVTAINGLTITAPVVVNVAAGQSETLTGMLALTATGTAPNPITIQKSGSGANPVLISYTGTVATASVLADGFLQLVGSDYVTIDGLDLQEAAANTTTTTVMEYGYALLKSSATDGAQNNTIKNCTITLNRVQNGVWTGVGHNGSNGIVVLNSLNSATGVVTPTAASGSNSYNKFYSNTIQNCNAGIVISGFASTVGNGPSPDPLTFLGDIGNDVGGNVASTGNTVLNFGGGSATNPATGIFGAQQWSMNCSYNLINNNSGAGVNHTTTLRGIFLNSGSTGASVNCNYNNVTLNGGATASSIYLIDVEFGSSGSGNTVSISNNVMNNSTYATSTTGAFYGIYATPSASNLLVNNNTLSGVVYSAATSATFYSIYAPTTATNLEFKNNMISSINMANSTGTFYGLYFSSPTNVEIANNTINSVIRNNSGTSYGIYSASSSVNEYIHHNLVKNFNGSTYTGSSSQTFYGIYTNTAAGIKNFYNNTVDSFQGGGTSTTTAAYGIRVGYGNTDSIYNNKVTNFSGLAQAYAYYFSGTTANSTYWVFNNIAANLQLSSIGSATTSAVYGYYTLGSTSTYNMFNNHFSDVSAPASASTNALIGFYLGGTAATATANLNYNTLNFNLPLTSTGTNFGGSGIFIANANLVTNIKNNIIRFASATGKGTAYFAALKRTSGTAGTKPANLTASNNIYIAPYIYGEGLAIASATNVYYISGGASGTADPNFNTSCGIYKVWMGENGTFSEDNLVSAATPWTYNPTGASYAKMNATNAINPAVTLDFNGVTRTAISDIGALEFLGTATDAAGPIIVYASIANPTNGCATVSLTAAISDASGVNTTTSAPRIWYKKSTNTDVLPSTNDNSTDGWKYMVGTGTSTFNFTVDYSKIFGGVAAGESIQYFVSAQDNQATPNVSSITANFASGFCPTSVGLSSSAFPLTNNTGLKTFVIPTLGTATAGTVSSNPAALCVSGTADLTFTPTSGTISAFLYDVQRSPVGTATWTTLASNLPVLP